MRAILGSLAIIDREDGLDADLAGDFAGGVAAHSIADDQQIAQPLGLIRRPNSETILVVIARLADIGICTVTQLHAVPNSLVRLLSGKYSTVVGS